jgi:predicted transcriptional regulator
MKNRVLGTPVAKSNSIELAGEIVTSFVSNNSVPRSDLPALIEAVHTALKSLAERGEVAAAVVDPPEPAVPIRKSVTPDYLICLEDGKKFKSLRRHLTTLGMTPEQYREKWNLPSTYPMVAPNYAAQRSALAKNIGLGQSRGRHLAARAALAGEDAINSRTPEPKDIAKSESVDVARASRETTEVAAPEPSSVAEAEPVAPSSAKPEAEEAAAPEPTNDRVIEAEPSEPSSASRRKPKVKAKTEAAENAPGDAPERKRGRPRKVPP